MVHCIVVIVGVGCGATIPGVVTVDLLVVQRISLVLHIHLISVTVV